MTEAAPLTALVARAARLYARRWPLYVGCAILVLAAQIGIDLTHALDKRLLGLVGGIVVLPMLAAIVYGFVGSDIAEKPTPSPAVWERIAERLWAVIAIDAITAIFGFANPGSDLLLGLVYLTGNLILAALLMYADVHAVIEPGLSVATVVPQSVLASARTAMSRVGYARAILLVFAQIVLQYVGFALDGAIGAHAFGLPSLGSTAFVTAVAGPFAALVTTIYVDLRGPK